MSRNSYVIGIVLVAIAGTVGLVWSTSSSSYRSTKVAVPEESEQSWSGPATERYTGQFDRVRVVFEHKDYTEYRLQTNELVRTGELNSERGYQTDPDATVYVLNWQKSLGEQTRYVRLTNEPNFLYLLDSNNEIVSGSRLQSEIIE